MINPDTPIEELLKICKSIEDLHKLLEQNPCESTDFDYIEVSEEMIDAAKKVVAEIPAFTTADIQRNLKVTYPQAAKLCDIIKDKNGGF